MFEIILLDENGNTIPYFYQWDKNRRIIIGGFEKGFIPPVVHFCNKNSTEVLGVQSEKYSDTEIIVVVPNILLEQPYNIILYVYLMDSEAEDASLKTTTTVEVPVRKRLKPSEYIYEENVSAITPDSNRMLINLYIERIQALENELSRMYGVALFTDSAEEIVNGDNTKVYVYTGDDTTINEVPFIQNHWYYFGDTNGWQDGGEYSTEAFPVDTTLSKSYIAADAAVVGNQFAEKQASIDQLNTDVSGVKNTVTEMQSSIQQLNETLDTVSGNVTTTSGKVDQLQTDMNTATENISTNTDDITTNKASIEANKKQIETNKTSITKNTKNISTNTNNISTLNVSVGELQNDVKDLYRSISTINETIVRIKAYINMPQ